MAQKGNAALESEISIGISTVTQTEGITPAGLGGILGDIADSARNITDDLTAIATGMTMAQVATAITGGTLVPLQWVLINNRPGGNQLLIQALTASTISPIGIQITGGIPCFVLMDYLNGYEGNTKPFIASFDATYKLWLTQKSGNSNGSINTILKASASLTFGTVAAGTNSDQTITVTGAAVGDPVILGCDTGTMGSGPYTCMAFVSSANTVTVRFMNNSGTTGVTPAAGVFNVTIIK